MKVRHSAAYSELQSAALKAGKTAVYLADQRVAPKAASWGAPRAGLMVVAKDPPMAVC